MNETASRGDQDHRDNVPAAKGHINKNFTMDRDRLGAEPPSDGLSRNDEAENENPAMRCAARKSRTTAPTEAGNASPRPGTGRSDETSSRPSKRLRHDHHLEDDSTLLREEERDYLRDMQQLRALDQQHDVLLSANAALLSERSEVGAIIAALRYIPIEGNPLLKMILTQHILYETHCYTLKLLQDEVFVALRHDLEDERPREYILQHLILPEYEDEDLPSIDLDQLVNILRSLPVDQLMRLLRPSNDM